MKIYLRMIKQWSRSCKPGMIVAFDETKGRRVIAGGFAKEVPDPKHPKKQAPVVETATAEPKAERAVVTPVILATVPAEPVEPAKTDKKTDKKRGK